MNRNEVTPTLGGEISRVLGAFGRRDWTKKPKHTHALWLAHAKVITRELRRAGLIIVHHPPLGAPSKKPPKSAKRKQGR